MHNAQVQMKANRDCAVFQTAGSTQQPFLRSGFATCRHLAHTAGGLFVLTVKPQAPPAQRSWTDGVIFECQSKLVNKMAPVGLYHRTGLGNTISAAEFCLPWIVTLNPHKHVSYNRLPPPHTHSFCHLRLLTGCRLFVKMKLITMLLPAVC